MIHKAIDSILELQSVSGTKQKNICLKNHKDDKDFKALLYFALNPLLTYKVSEKTLGVPVGGTPYFYENIYDVCTELSAKKAVDDDTLRRVRSWLSDQTKGEQKFYIKLLSKTLRLGVTEKTVNKMIPNLIPEWEVQQAYPIDKYPLKKDVWFTLTQKLNGVRATYYHGQLIARSGIPYEGLDHIIQEIQRVAPEHLVFDGELTLSNRNGLSDNEAFRVATGLINAENANKMGICYTIFDVLPDDEFSSGESVEGYKFRREQINKYANKFTGAVSVLPTLYQGTDQSQIDELLNQMVAEDKEGLMVNLDVPYKCKRHNGILKVKRFYTMDLPIIGVEEGSGRLAGSLGALVVDYKGNAVRVGSGFSDVQRVAYWMSQDQLIGTLCEVKYKEISSDKHTGAESLQFPVFVSLREDKSEVSYG